MPFVTLFSQVPRPVHLNLMHVQIASALMFHNNNISNNIYQLHIKVYAGGWKKLE